MHTYSKTTVILVAAISLVLQGSFSLLFAQTADEHEYLLITSDVLTNPDTEDGYALGNNRYLSPVIGFPALTVPAGFTTDNLPVGLEFLGRPFTAATLLRFGYAYEQRTTRRQQPRPHSYSLAHHRPHNPPITAS